MRKKICIAGQSKHDIVTPGLEHNARSLLEVSRTWMLANGPIVTLPFSSYLTLNNTVTLKCGLEVTQGH